MKCLMDHVTNDAAEWISTWTSVTKDDDQCEIKILISVTAI